MIVAKNRPNVLTIAGFDPSNGAGLTADIKTFEALKVYGLAICTANTIQNDIEFRACHWTAVEVMKNQIDLLFERFSIAIIKIGIIENWSILNQVLDMIITKNSTIKVILDPVLSSSTNFLFHNTSNNEFDKVLEKIYLLTPNFEEIQMMYPEKTITETIEYIKKKTNVLLKGGHRKDLVGQDELFMTDGRHVILKANKIKYSPKHGSGCILSSSIAGYLAIETNLELACKKAKRYTETFLTSNESLLGYHH